MNKSSLRSSVIFRSVRDPDTKKVFENFALFNGQLHFSSHDVTILKYAEIHFLYVFMSLCFFMEGNENVLKLIVVKASEFCEYMKHH